MSHSPSQDTVTGAAESWWLRLAVLTMAHAIGTLGMMSVLALGPLIQGDLALTATQFGLLVAAYGGCQALGSPLAGQVADRLGVGRTLALAMIIFTVSILLVSRADALSAALVGVAGLGLGYAFVNPATARGVMDWAPATLRATGMGIKQTGVPLGGVLGAGAALLAAVIDWRMTLVCVGGLSLLALVPCIGIARADPGRRGTPRSLLSTWPRLITNRNLGTLSLATAGLNMCQASFFGFLTLFMKDAVGFSAVAAGLCLGVSQAAAAIGRVAWGIIGDRSFAGRRNWLYVGVGTLAAAFLLAFAMVRRDWFAFAVVMATLLGLTVGSYAAIVQTLVVEAVAPEETGAASGYHLFVISLGNMAGPLVFGAFVDHTGSYALGWMLLAAIAAASIVLLVVGFSDQRQWQARRAPGPAFPSTEK